MGILIATREFKDDLARDFAYAQANDCLTATENGVSTRLTSRNSDYIWREIAEGEFAGYKEDAMEEPVIELDFGNGSRLRICAAPDADPDTRSVNVRLEREGEVRSIRVNGCGCSISSVSSACSGAMNPPENLVQYSEERLFRGKSEQPLFCKTARLAGRAVSLPRSSL